MDAVIRLVETVAAVIVATGAWSWYQITFNAVG